LNRRYQRTATTITSGGNRNPVNADFGGSQGRGRFDSFTAQVCLDLANAQRNRALNSGLWGAAFGFFPIMWIVINAIWVYNLTVQTGHFDVLRRSFASISDQTGPRHRTRWRPRRDRA
jgi:hypothetical protein